MALFIRCDGCGMELDKPSALLFGPPSYIKTCSKRHLCETCFNAIGYLLNKIYKKANDSEEVK